MATLTQAKRDIARAKRTLICKAGQQGIYENFGQREVRKLKDKYFDCTYANNGVWLAIADFEYWAESYTGQGA